MLFFKVFRIQRKEILELVFLFFGIIVIGCQKQRTPRALVIGIPADARTLNPLLSTNSIDQDIQEQLFLRLLQEKPELNRFAPELAKRWESGANRRKITFTLRSDVYWSDGVPVTAEDVAFTFRQETNPALGWILQSQKEMIDSVIVVNDTIVTFYYSKYYPYQLTDANEGFIIPAHVLRNLPAEAWKTTLFNKTPVTNGPYRLKKWMRQQAIELEANPNYFRKGFPKIKHVLFKVVSDASVRLSQIKNGEIDILEGVSVRQIGHLKRKLGVHVASFPDMAFGFLGWNERDPLFRSRKIRQALAMAINRKAIIKNIFGDYAIPLNSPVLPQFWAYCDTLRPFPYAPEKASEIFAREGWREVNGSGRLEKNGKPFRFELMTNFGNPARRDLAILIQAELKKIGIDAHIQLYDWSIFLDRFRKGDYQAVLSAWRVSSKLDLRSFWHSESIKNGFNRFFYRNPEVDSLIDRVAKMPDRNQAKKLWWKLQSLIYLDQPVTFLYVPDRVIVYRNCLKKPIFHPLSTYYYLYKWNWNRDAF